MDIPTVKAELRAACRAASARCLHVSEKWWVGRQFDNVSGKLHLPVHVFALYRAAELLCATPLESDPAFGALRAAGRQHTAEQLSESESEADADVYALARSYFQSHEYARAAGVLDAFYGDPDAARVIPRATNSATTGE
jgi:hypothetical protein